MEALNSEEFERLRAVEETHAWFVGRRRALRPLLARADERAPCGPALDLGIGSGGNRRLLRETLTPRELIEVDSSPLAIGPRLLRADAHTVPLRSEVLGVVTAFDVMEHCADDVAVLVELSRCLKPGGEAVFSVPAFAALFSDHDRALGHARRYDRGVLESRLVDAGFEIRERRAFNIATLVPLALLRKLRPPAPVARSDVHALPKPLNFALDWTLALEERLPLALRKRYGLSWMIRAAKR